MMNYKLKNGILVPDRRVCSNGFWGWNLQPGGAQAPAPASGGGGSSGFINDPLTSGDGVTTYTNHAGDSWSFGAGGATFQRSASFSVGGSIEIADIVPDTNVFEIQYRYKGGTDSTPRITLWALADGVNGDEPNNGLGIEVTATAMQVAVLSAGSQTNLDTTAITLALNDIIKIRVAKNGSNWDIRGYQNDNEICLVENRSWPGAGNGDNSSIGIEAIGSGETVIVADWFGEVIS